MLSPDQRRDFDEARRLGKSRLGAEDLVRAHHIEPCADASGPSGAINPPQGHSEAEAGGARSCLRCFPPASLPFNATAPFRANPLFYLERARGFEPPTPTLARLCSTPELHPHRSGGVCGLCRRHMIAGDTRFASLAFGATLLSGRADRIVPGRCRRH